MSDFPHTPPRQSWTFSNDVNAEIRRAAATGIYDIRGGGSKRRLPHFDDLLFLGASISRYPLEGYREKHWGVAQPLLAPQQPPATAA
jgi:hypothetical protein